MASLLVEFKSRRSNSLEKKVCALVHSLENSETLAGARNAFNFDLPKIKTGNHAKTEVCYKMLSINTSIMPPHGIPVENVARLTRSRVDEAFYDRLEVWKLDGYGELDRLIAIITEIKNEK